MSSLLEQAIIDAKLLKETARKNAEAAILEQYADEIKQEIDSLLLEEDEMGPDLGAPEGGVDTGANALGASPGPLPSLGGDTSGGVEAPEMTPQTKRVMDKVNASYLGEDNMQEIELNLESIIEKIDSLEKDLNMKTPDFSAPPHEQSNIPVAPEEGLSESVEEEAQDEELKEQADELDENDEETSKLEEEIILDMDTTVPGGINFNHIEIERQNNIVAALEAQKEDLQEQLDSKLEELDQLEVKVQNALTKLQETREKLKKSVELNVKLKEGFEFLTKKVNDINVLNARLLYTNKVLGNSSMNERQKKQIAESISSAKTVEEAKTIFETLQKSTEIATEKRVAPKSLTEVVKKSSAPFLPRVNQTINPETERWKIIAGIKKR